MAAMSSNPTEHPGALIEQVRAAAADRQPLRIVGGDTKAFYGHPTTGTPLVMAAWSGIVSFEPTELVVTVRAGTPLTELEAVLADKGQCFPFEPPRFGAGGTVGGGSTITKDTPPGGLAVARGKQVTVSNWQRPAKTKS